MSHALTGVLPVVQTPFHDDETVDWPTLRREVDWLFEHGANGLVAAMVSEWLMLTEDERERYTAELTEAAGDRGPVVVSVGAEWTGAAVRLARIAEQAGCAAVMAIPPLSRQVPPSALLDYYRAIAEATALPLIVQDASSYVGSPLPIDVMVRLLDVFGPEKILFKPEAAPLGPNFSLLRDATGGQAQIFDGSGGIALVDTFHRGIVGTMPGADLVRAIVPLWHALVEGNEERAYRIAGPLCQLVAMQMQAGLGGFLAIEKYLLVKQEVFHSARCRSPQGWQLDEETAGEVDRVFERLLAATG